MRQILFGALAGVLAVAMPITVAAGERDHPAPSEATSVDASSQALAGGAGAEWDLLGSFITGNPHTDIDFFTQDGNMYASVGTLAAGANGGGQTIVRLMDGGEVSPAFVSSHPSATCISNLAAALSLQHDVEATPKGNVLFNTRNPFADRRDAQLLIDSTDASGRCHDQGTAGLSGAPRGGLEIIDITDIENPVEIGMTSHIGEAHTVNIDPKRPHIAFAVSSDGVGIDNKGTDKRSDDVRRNENPDDTQRFRLDGFEIVDLSSCMNFGKAATVEDKRARCRPEVFRYRYPSMAMAIGHTDRRTLYGCHELEIYPNDRLTCGSGQALLVFDLSNAFDDNGTPNNFRDDRPRGTPLPCAVRASTSVGAFLSGAMVTDCVTGKKGTEDVDLSVANWLKTGAPSIRGVRHVGTVFHMGRSATQSNGVQTAYGPKEDIDFNHEAEFTHSGKFLLATDERGGGVSPPGASCSPVVDNPEGNGGIHAYAVSRLQKTVPSTAEAAWRPYARTPSGDKAVYRAQIRTQPQATVCTAHVFQQIPGQNRIFMGWYSQGTQVVDYVERANGTFEFKDAGFFIPENANTWVSHIYKFDKNRDGTYTYYGATGDFNVGAAGRNAIDLYQVTLPAPGAKKPSGGSQDPDPNSNKNKKGDDDKVKGTVLTRPATAAGGTGAQGGSLAATGANVAGFVLIGLALVTIGLSLARDRKEAVGRPYPRM